MINPLRQLREDMGHSAASFARKHRVNINAVQLSEAGCYSKPLPFYAPYLQPRDHRSYQTFRKAQRHLNFPTPPPVLPLPELLSSLNLSSYTLGVKLCVQPADIYRMLKKDRIKVPQEIITALQDVGWTIDDIKYFASRHFILLLAKDKAVV